MNIQKLKIAKEKNEVLKGVVRLIYRDPKLETDIVLIDLNGFKGIITREELDAEVNWGSLTAFVGREITFVVKEIHEEEKSVILSRKEAQLKTRDAIVERLANGEVMAAKVVKLLKYGAFIEIDGVSGLLKNQHFAVDHTTVKEILRIGDSINVRLIKSGTKLAFEAVEKYKNPTIFDFSIFEPDQIVLGTACNVQPWGAFVRIAPNIDALCNLPGTGELDAGSQVRFRITKVNHETEQIRGKIVEVI